MKYQVQISYTNPAHDHVTLRRRVETITRLVEASTEGEALNRAANQQRALGFIIREAKVIESDAKKEKEQLEEVQLNEEVEQVKEGAKEDAAKLLGGPVKTKPKMPPGKRSPGSRYVRGLARRAMKAGMKKEEVEQIDEEGRISHIVAKNKLQDHKDAMESEGYDTVTKSLPKDHPKAKTHTGIVAQSPVEHDYHSSMGHAEPVNEEVESVPTQRSNFIGKSHLKRDHSDELGSRYVFSTDPAKMKKSYSTEKGQKNAANRNVANLKATIQSSLGKHSQPNLPEEAEQIDELKKSTLVSYVGKAAGRLAAASRLQRDFEKDGNTALAGEFEQSAQKKKVGIQKAANKLAKEEVGADKRDAGYKMSPAVRKAQAESDRLSKVEKPVQAGTLAAQRRREAMKKEEVNLSEQEVINNKKSKAADTAKKMINAAKGKMNKINLDPKVDTDNQKTKA